MKTFGLMGAAGYIAPRHMRAIKETGNELIAALDPNDSVGIIDSFFPNCHFFTEFERFDRHIDKQARSERKIDFISICSPNYLHDSHIRFALRSGANAICEKPLVLNPWNIDALREFERDYDRRINTILQLRLHPSIIRLKSEIAQRPLSRKSDVDLTYITSRGKWYSASWKGDDKKSGGVATNIGVHFFDMLHFLFGDLQDNRLFHSTHQTASGFLEYERARVRWFLSTDFEQLPSAAKLKGQRTFRSITVDNKEIEFSDGFTDLHTKSYEAVLAGNGFGLEDNVTAIETVSGIRMMKPSQIGNLGHPFLHHVS
ncbi:Gfo/Idh/MocA family oxidoreductase [Alteromonas oceanisediminis]|uniref:Gfo/Idh/MocA family oxidoreductase n=1 Tax=Alteromonas oceanisediminis TaxID=2836180 RepID=UPI001BDB1242|nr:Gfo/Idh/MocA family oxidoreductase [Alteromonas oceanisediminis]MBT0584929.1 Gfo/Idh/MocA family oxidoreductase [Alteromonas oceanisediminis]